jgi:hypothetical protein
MFNLFWIPVTERIEGRRLSALLAKNTGANERTWRNRLNKGLSPRLDTLAAEIEHSIAYNVEQLQKKCKWSATEANEIVANRPSELTGEGLPTADLIYWNSPDNGKEYVESIAVASQFDRFCNAYMDAHCKGDLPAAKLVLLDAAAWLRTFSPAGANEADWNQLGNRLKEAADLKTLRESAKPLDEALVMHVLSCWDLEFCSQYFGASMLPFPLFELIMPRLTPEIHVDPETLRFLRGEQKPERGIFERSISRLLDFVAVLVYWKKYRRMPDTLPRVTEMAAWFKQDESKIVKWRHEERPYTGRDFNNTWEGAFALDSQGLWPPMPTPMLVAAHFFSPLLVREEGKIKEWIICQDDYERWWLWNLDRLSAKGLEFGLNPWPRCLIYQPLGNRSPESWRSSQSSGRSSQPLDSQ